MNNLKYYSNDVFNTFQTLLLTDNLLGTHILKNSDGQYVVAFNKIGTANKELQEYLHEWHWWQQELAAAKGTDNYRCVRSAYDRWYWSIVFAQTENTDNESDEDALFDDFDESLVGYAYPTKDDGHDCGGNGCDISNSSASTIKDIEKGCDDLQRKLAGQDSTLFIQIDGLQRDQSPANKDTLDKVCFLIEAIRPHVILMHTIRSGYNTGEYHKLCKCLCDAKVPVEFLYTGNKKQETHLLDQIPSNSYITNRTWAVIGDIASSNQSIVEHLIFFRWDMPICDTKIYALANMLQEARK